MRGATRWYRGLSTEAPPEDLFRPSEYDVAPIDERNAKEFVVTHHYSRSYPNARFRFGIYGPDGLAGVAVFSRGTNDLAILNAFPGIDIRCGVELGRFVLLNGVRFNAETWFLGRCF